MNHKIVSAVVSLLTILLFMAGVIFAITVQAATNPAEAEGDAAEQPMIPAILHPVEDDMADCARCHNEADDSLPANHATYGVGACQTCHAIATELSADAALAPAAAATDSASAADAATPVSSAPVDEASVITGNPVPHPITGKYAECVKCHAIGGRRSMPPDHADYTNTDCQECHTVPTAAGEAASGGQGNVIPHPVTEIFAACDTCHAIGNVKLAMPANHASYANTTCQKCHKLTD